MTKRSAGPDASPPAATPPVRQKEYTPEIVRGGAYDEDGKLVHETLPEPDDHRMKKPAR